MELREFTKGLLDKLPNNHPDREAIKSIAMEVDDYIDKARKSATSIYVEGNVTFIQTSEGIVEADSKTGLVRRIDSKGNRTSYFFGLKE